MSIIRPLLIFLDLNGIYIINAIILAIIAFVLLLLLMKTKIKELVIAYILGLVMCTVFVVPLCLEYYWTFLIMFVVSIISIILDSKGKKLNSLFLISGIITCYLDFLTTEIITILVPIIILMTIRYKQDRLINFKEGFKFLIISAFFWGIGYVGMWLTKWILASIILNVNAWDYIKDYMMNRIDGSGSMIKNVSNLSMRAIRINIRTIYPLNILRKYGLTYPLLISIMIVEIMLINNIKKLYFSGLLLIIAMIPYIRYAILASHSYTHNYFTFRSQIISIMAIFLAIIYSIDKNKLKKDIKICRRKFK